MSNNFYPLTPQTLEKLLLANLTAAEWRLWSYLVVSDPWGDSYRDLPDTLIVMEKVATCSEFGITVTFEEVKP